MLRLLSLHVPMEFTIMFDMVASGWSIIYTEGSQVIISRKYYISFSENRFALVNSADPVEMPHYAAFHLGLHSLTKYPFKGFWSTKG